VNYKGCPFFPTPYRRIRNRERIIKHQPEWLGKSGQVSESFPQRVSLPRIPSLRQKPQTGYLSKLIFLLNSDNKHFITDSIFDVAFNHPQSLLGI
jgi:hypothetical protein